MPAGGVELVSTGVPKNATTMRFAPVVVTDGAVIEVDDALTCPLLTSTGADVSTPLYATIPPEADWELEKVNVYDDGSEPVATLTNTARRIVEALMSWRTSVPPAGGVSVGAP